MRISDWSSDVSSSDLLRGEIDFGTRLKNQALRDALVVIALEAAEDVAIVQEEQRTFNLEAIGREALVADGRVGPRRDIGRASGRDRGCQYVYISMAAVSTKK